MKDKFRLVLFANQFDCKSVIVGYGYNWIPAPNTEQWDKFVPAGILS